MLLGPENQSGPQQHFLLTLPKHISFHLLLPEILFPPLRAERENASFMTSTIPFENTETHTLYNTYYTHTHTHTHTHTEASHMPHKHRPYHTREHLPGPSACQGLVRGQLRQSLSQQMLMFSTGLPKHIKTSSLFGIDFFLSTI